MDKKELDFKITLQNNIGLIKAGIWNGTAIGMTYGGTGAKLVPIVGGIVTSGGSALEILSPGTSGQMLVTQGSGLAPIWVDAPEIPQPGNWGSFWDNTDQTAVANTPVAMLVCIADPNNTGIFHSNGSRINIVNKGVYNIQFSAQFQNITNNVYHDATIWLRVNGVDVPDTAGFVSVDGQHSGTPGASIVSWNYIMNFSAGDYFELWWHNDHADLFMATLPAGTSPDHPGSPAVIVTIQQVLHTQATAVLGGGGVPSGVTSVNGLTGVVTGIATTAGNLSQFATTSSAQLLALLSDETGTGANVFATSPTLVTPNLGTPSTLVGTNITGTATAFTASNVTTNANLTGHITSVGNAAALGAFNSSHLAAALSDETGTGVAVFGTSPAITTSITTPSTTFSLVNTTATTLNVGGAATSLTTGATTGTMFLRNPVITIGSTASSIITTSAAGTNSLSISPNGSLYLTPAITGIGGDTTQILITNNDNAAGTFMVTGGDVYLTNKTDSLSTTTPVNLIFEGVTNNSFQTTITPTDPTADRTITLPDATGTVALTTNKLSAFASTSSSELISVISDETGSGSLVFATSPTLVTPAIGTPSSGVLTNCTGLPNSATTATASAVANTIVLRNATNDTALRDIAVRDVNASRNVNCLDLISTNAVSAAAMNLVDDDVSNFISLVAPGTLAANNTYTLPASVGTVNQVLSIASITGNDATLQWATGGGNALTANPLSQFAATTSAQLAGVISDETGSGSLVFANTPTLVTPVIGAATGTSLTVSSGITLGASALISSSDPKICSSVPAGTGVVPTVQIICPAAAYTLTNGNTAQDVFSDPYDTITLVASTTYMFEGQYIIANGTTTHTTAMSFVLNGGASMTNCTWTASTGSPAALNAGTSGNFHAIFNAVAGGNCNTTTNAANTVIRFQGIMRVNAGGTLVPQITFSAAPGGTNQTSIGSYLKFYPVGINTMSSVGTAIG